MPPGPEDDENGCSVRGPTNSRYRQIVPILLLLLCLQTLGLKIMYLPLNRVIQLRYCQDYYFLHDPALIGPGGDVPERLCRVESVQQKLAWLFGMIETLHLIIDIAVTIPFGILSDKGFRRVVLVLNYIGFIAMYSWILLVGYLPNVFPTNAMLLGPVLSLIGGGDCVFMSTIAAVIADIAPDDVSRTSIFAYISSVTYVTHLISPSMAAVTMQRSLWLPFMIGLSLLATGVPLVSMLPSPDCKTNTAIISTILSGAEEEEEETPLLPAKSPLKPLPRLHNLYTQLRGRSNFQLLLSLFLIAALASSNSPLFPQYISTRYSWNFANAGYLLSLKALINILLLTVFVPYAITFLSTHSHLSAGNINRLGAMLMLSISVIGALLIALAPGVPALVVAFFVYAFGSALPVFTLSLVKDKAVAERNDELEGTTDTLDYSVVMIAKYAGNMVGLPLMTVVWAESIGLGGWALGMPWILSAVFYGIGYFLTRALRLDGVGADSSSP